MDLNTVSLCECGCGTPLSTIPQRPPRGPRRFIHNHHRSKSSTQYEISAEGCWVWQRSISDDGYPTMGIGNRRTAKAHKVFYEEANGSVPDGCELHHKCGNRICVNPEHLEPPLTRLEHRRRHLRAGEGQCLAI